MYKLYRKYRGKDIELDSDDIKGIKKLYRIRPSDRGNPNCKDKNRRMCEHYKEMGYCAPEYKAVMKEYCQFTCDLCDSWMKLTKTQDFFSNTIVYTPYLYTELHRWISGWDSTINESDCVIF